MSIPARFAKRSLFPLLATALLATACGDDDSPADETDTGGDASTDADAGDTTGDTDAGTDALPDTTGDTTPDTDEPEACDIAAATDTRIVAGDYFLAVSVEPLGGLLIFFRVEIYADEDESCSSTSSRSRPT
jgi:hypothetical protein